MKQHRQKECLLCRRDDQQNAASQQMHSATSEGWKRTLQQQHNQQLPPDNYTALQKKYTIQHTHTHTRLTALFPGLPRWAGTRKVKPIWILLKQETVSGSGISWAICKSAPCSRQITMPAPHHSVFYRPDALPAAQTTASKHWRHKYTIQPATIILKAAVRFK